MSKSTYYVCFNDNPLAYGQWAKNELEVVSEHDTRGEAELERSRLSRNYRLLSGGYGYYTVLDHKPEPVVQDLRPFDPAYAGESMDGEYPDDEPWEPAGCGSGDLYL